MFKKIDIYYNGAYIYTTTQSKTCKEAKERFIKNPTWQGLTEKGFIGTCTVDNNFDSKKVTAHFKKK